MDASFLEPLSAAINRGLRLGAFEHFWLEVGYASGGSENQVELPRGASAYFGYTFHHGTDAQVTIGHPTICVGKHRSARVLSWHGDNQMERINVPTRSQGGPPVRDRVIRFTRTGSEFEMTVVDEESQSHLDWIRRSAAAHHLYRLGRTARTFRRCGIY